MKLIKEITDQDVIGTSGRSAARPRITARAILKDFKNRYILIFSGDFDFYSFPGGGVKENESIVSALKREVSEETGCSCDVIEELGMIRENRAHCDYTQISYYFVVTTASKRISPSFTKLETENGTKADWYTLDDVVELIKRPACGTAQKKFLMARDIAALDEYLLNFGSDVRNS